MRDVVIAGAVRTPIGRMGGALSSFSAADLGAVVLVEAVKRSGLKPEDIGEVIMGQVIQAGCGPNPARQALLLAGFPESLPGVTVNKVCASGMKAVALGALSVAAGEQEIVAAGGMECMSRAPYLLPDARDGYYLGDGKLVDSLIGDSLYDPIAGCHMGVTAENLAEEFHISREEQDEFALASQMKVKAAQESGAFDGEIVPVMVKRKKGNPIPIDKDAFPRPDTTLEGLAKLKPAFKEDGTVTAGNASGINDGAAAMVVLSSEEAEKRGIKPMGRILATASAGYDPTRMGLTPVFAARTALAKAGLTLEDIQVVELNEAFSAQSLAVIKELGLDPDLVNMNGGAISLGHPVGVSGARILVTLLHLMENRGLGLGMALICVGGGQGMAMIIERGG